MEDPGAAVSAEDLLIHQARLLSVVAVVNLVLADAWGVLVDPTTSMLVPFLVGATATLWATPLSELAYFRIHGYLKRSAVSLLLRMFAVITYSLAAIVFALILTRPAVETILGLKSLAAGLGAISNFLLGWAIDRVEAEANSSSLSSSPMISGAPPKKSYLFRASLALLACGVPLWLINARSVSLAAFLIGAPLAHLGAFESMRESHGYRLWQPLVGGIHFLVAVGLAWLAYGLALGSLVTMHFNPNLAVDSEGSMLLAFVSHVLLLYSKQVFEAPNDTSLASPNVHSRGMRKRKISSASILGTNPRPLSKTQLVLAAALAYSNFMVLKTWSISWQSITMGAIGSLVVVDRFAPFKGGASHVLEQAMGWTMWSLCTLTEVVFAMNGFSNGWSVVVSVSKLATLGALHLSTSSFKSGVDESEQNPDVEELNRLLKLCRSSTVEAILLRTKARLSGEPELRALSVILCIFSLLAAHASLFLFALAELWKSEIVTGSGIALSIANAIFAHGACGSALHPEGYSFLHPFRGGVRHVIPQSIGWTLLVLSLLGQQIILAKVGLLHTSNGVVGAFGMASYVSQLVLLFSALKFDRNAPHLGGAFSGGLLSILACVLFVCVDLAILQWGVPADLMVPVVFLAWLTIIVSAPLTYLYSHSIESLQGGKQGAVGGFEVFGLAAWTFSILLGLLVLGNAESSVVWLATKTGAVNLVGHMLASGQSRVLGSQFVVFLASAAASAFFLYVSMPLIRAFLDGPMHYYAYVFKSWSWARSPDGSHPMDNVAIHRNVSYGSNVMDILAPASPPTASSSSASEPPVVQVHGGGFMFCRRELTTHSMTPIPRHTGVTVYSVEYPLAPEARFPAALVCILEACRFVAANHCRGTCLCLNPGPPLRCEACGPAVAATKPVPVRIDRASPSQYHAYPCRCCPHERGAPSVQLLGDSAGGNLVAMCTALLCNPKLLEQLTEHAAPEIREWRLPSVQRLAVFYGVLGKDITYDQTMARQESFSSWLVERAGALVVSFVLDQYRGSSTCLDGRVVLTDLESDLKDFAPETLLCCGVNDPLLATQRHAVHVIRRATGRSVKVIEIPGATHAFHGVPPQWNPRWKTDAFPATRELVRFLSGGDVDIGADPTELPWDISPLIVFPGIVAGLAFAVTWLWGAIF